MYLYRCFGLELEVLGRVVDKVGFFEVLVACCTV